MRWMTAVDGSPGSNIQTSNGFIQHRGDPAEHGHGLANSFLPMRKIAAITILFCLTAFAEDEVGVGPRVLDGTNIVRSVFPTAAYIENPIGGGFIESCTGTLIASRYVLTAGHCVTDDNNIPNLTTATTIDIAGVTYHVSRYWRHPTWNGQLGRPDIFDAAIIELDADVPLITPSIVNRSALQAGEIITIVGFGRQGDGFTGTTNQYPPAGMVAFGDATIDDLSVNSVYEWTFHQGESNIGQGDSGGPAFLDDDSVAGINSFNTGDGDSDGLGNGIYGTPSGVTRVDVIANFIDSIVGYTNLKSATQTQIPATFKRGGTFSLSTTVTNEGYVNAMAFSVDYYLSTDRTLDAGDILLGTASVGGALARTTVAAPLSAPTPNVPIGQYYVIWVVDANDDVFQSNINDDVFTTSLPITVKDNEAPSIASAITVEPAIVFAGQPAALTVVPSDPDDTILFVAWDFGDGTTGSGATVSHSFGAAGSYTVTATASDPFGAMAQQSGTISVRDFHQTSLNAKLGMNFVRSFSDSLDVTLPFDKDFSEFDRFVFSDKATGEMKLFIGTVELDSARVFSGKGSSVHGKIKWSKSGSIRWTIKKADLRSLMAEYGINTETSSTSTNISISVQLPNGQRYGNTKKIFYFGKPGKSGKGF